MFIILNLLWRKKFVRNHTGIISAVFLVIYGLSRISMEFFREPDRQIGYIAGSVTMGQILSLPFLNFGFIYSAPQLKKRINSGFNCDIARKFASFLQIFFGAF